MRLAFIIVLTLTGCSREPSFDERYAATQQQLAKKSAAIERELAPATATASDAATGH